MATVQPRATGRRSPLGALADRIGWRRSVAEPTVDPIPLDRPRVGSAPVTETIDEFCRAAASISSIAEVTARSRGEHVDFIVRGDRVWHETIDSLEPRLHDLIVSRGADFDYIVVRPGIDPQPSGYTSVYVRA